MPSSSSLAMAALGLAALSFQPAAQALPLQISPPGAYNSFGPSISFDGQRVAYYSANDAVPGGNADNSFEIYVYDRATAGTKQLSSFAGGGLAGGNQTPMISGDGKSVAFQHFETSGGFGYFQTQLVDVASGNLRTLTPLGAFGETSTLSADGKTVAVNTGNSGLRLYDVTAGSFGPVLAMNPLSVSLNGDATRMVLSGFNGSVTLRDLAAGTESAIAPGGFGLNPHAVISQDGSRVAFTARFNLLGTNADGNYEVFLYDVASGVLSQLTHSTGGDARDVSLSADGRRLAFSSTADLLGSNADHDEEIFIFDLVGDVITQITDTVGKYNLSAAISGDGLSLAFVSNADFSGRNANGAPQIYLQSLAPLGNVPEPGTLALVAGAGLMLLRRPRRYGSAARAAS